MENAVIVSGARTAVSKSFTGSLVQKTPTELGVLVANEAMKRAGVKINEVDEFIFGQVGQDNDVPNVARNIVLNLPADKTYSIGIPAYTVQRNCASGLQAIMNAADQIRNGNADVIVAGGTESMSSTSYRLKDPAFFRMLLNVKGAGKLLEEKKLSLDEICFALKDSKENYGKLFLVNQLLFGLSDPCSGIIMGETADNLADKYDITREEMDKFSVESHRKAFNAQKNGKFIGEILPVNVGGSYFSIDECVRERITVEKLAEFKPYFRKEGRVTIANSCPINDGSAAVVVMSEKKALEKKLPILAYITAYGSAGCDPLIMGIGPYYSTTKVLSRANIETKDIDIFELNEAFAAVALANIKELELDPKKVNVNGGAIALGHPVGATGAKLTISMLYEMQRRDLKKGVVTLCIGGGQGATMLLEKIPRESKKSRIIWHDWYDDP